MILHGIEYQRPTSLNMRILADHVTYSFLAFMKSIFHFCLGCYCGGYSQNGRSNLSSLSCSCFPGRWILITCHWNVEVCDIKWITFLLLLPTPHKTYRTRAPATKPGSSWEKVYIKSNHPPFKSQLYGNSIDRVVLCHGVWYCDHMTSQSCRKS